MATTILSDDVINSTEFRSNHSRWFNKAYISPITIMNRNRPFVLLNRESAKNLYQLTHYGRLVVQFCQEHDAGRSKKSDAFPWAKYLDEESMAEFHKELLSTFYKALHSLDSSILEEMINDWMATAKVMGAPKLSEALLQKDSPSEYVEVTD